MKARFTVTCKPGELKVGTKVELWKDPKNEFDNEAIEVLAGDNRVGYVSAYYKTRKPGTMSAGRLLDKIPDNAEAVIVADQIGEVETID